jgi:protein TonB
MVTPVVLLTSVLTHVAVLVLAAYLPHRAQAGVIEEVPFEVELLAVAPPEPEPEPEPEVAVAAAAEPEPEPERPRPEPERPERVVEELRPPEPEPAAIVAPVLTAEGPAVEPTFAVPPGDADGQIVGRTDGVVGGGGRGAAPAEETPPAISRRELRRRLLRYIRGSLSAFVNGHLSYPLAARREHQEGVVVLRLRLDEGGRLLAVRLGRSSGFPILDRSALSTVQDLSQFPAPPETIPWDAARELPLPVTYVLD